ncbi:hypothetical protein RAS2_07930 [Phycisphaerae bacterium RAS2]|nr:hypothetical protein RAS2_07930 [Phycisphaerae bacterium RAS2]
MANRHEPKLDTEAKCLGRGNRLVMQHHQLIRFQGRHGVCAAMSVSELNLERVGREDFHDRADLATDQPARGEVFDQSDHVKQMDRFFHDDPVFRSKHKTRRQPWNPIIGSDNPRGSDYRPVRTPLPMKV